MRHLDHVFEAWPVANEGPAVRERVALVQAELDRGALYLDVVRGQTADVDEAALAAALFEPGWIWRPLRLRAELGRLIRSALANDTLRPVLVMCYLALGRTAGLLRAIARARRRGDAARAAALVQELDAHESALADAVHREVLTRTLPPSPFRCPRCREAFVVDEVFLGRYRLLGCKRCANAESAPLESPELAALLRRWA